MEIDDILDNEFPEPDIRHTIVDAAVEKSDDCDLFRLNGSARRRIEAIWEELALKKELQDIQDQYFDDF